MNRRLRGIALFLSALLTCLIAANGIAQTQIATNRYKKIIVVIGENVGYEPLLDPNNCLYQYTSYIHNDLKGVALITPTRIQACTRVCLTIFAFSPATATASIPTAAFAEAAAARVVPAMAMIAMAIRNRVVQQIRGRQSIRRRCIPD
jgi:hypothetical protein